MATQLTGIVTNGQLHLDQPLSLPDQSRVMVTVEPAVQLPADWSERFAKGLETWKKLIEEHPVRSGGMHFTRDELHERDFDERTSPKKASI